MRLKSLKIGRVNESPEETGREEPVTATEVTFMEEKINEKTKKLRHAIKQLKGLTNPRGSTGENAGEIPGSHGPLIELTLEPDDDFMDPASEKDPNTLPGENKNPDDTAPEVSVRELIDELEEIEQIIRGRLPS